jgi:hypothetical protein
LISVSGLTSKDAPYKTKVKTRLWEFIRDLWAAIFGSRIPLKYIRIYKNVFFFNNIINYFMPQYLLNGLSLNFIEFRAVARLIW